MRSLYRLFLHLGGFGLLALGIMDSTLLFFLPFGIDLLMVALSARAPARFLFYAAMATAGSLIGCAFTYTVSRKGGEEGLEKHVPRRRLEYVKSRMKKRAGWALALAAMMPPPFPFTPFLIAAGALQYPRKRLLAIIGAARFARFSLEGLLAIVFGRQILRLANEPVVFYSIVGLIVLSIAGSAFTIVRWARASRKAPKQ